MLSIKKAGIGDWFSVSPEGRANLEQASRQTAIQGAIRSLMQHSQDPALSQIVAQLQSMLTRV